MDMCDNLRTWTKHYPVTLRESDMSVHVCTFSSGTIVNIGQRTLFKPITLLYAGIVGEPHDQLTYITNLGISKVCALHYKLPQFLGIYNRE